MAVVAPAIKSMFVQFLSADTRSKDGKDTEIVTFLTVEGEVIDMVCSTALWAKFSRFVNDENPYCSIKAEVRVKDKTGYTDASGVEKQHTSDGFALNGLVRVPEKIWNSKIENRESEDLMTIQASGETASAVATYLAAIRTR